MVELDLRNDKYEEIVVKAIKATPKWSPATYRGTPVSSKVNFVINEDFR